MTQIGADFYMKRTRFPHPFCASAPLPKRRACCLLPVAFRLLPPACCLLLSAFFLLAACSTATPTPTPTVNAIASQVAWRLTQTASAPTNAPRPVTPTPTFTAPPAPSVTPSATPTPQHSATPAQTLTPSPEPRATERLSTFPRPPEKMTGLPHFYLGPPAGGFIGSTYRYGSVGPGQRFAPHHGVDYSTGAGETLVAVAAGTVYYAGDDLTTQYGPQLDFYGHLVVIQLAQTWDNHVIYALYGHLAQVLVQTGQMVNVGDAIGAVGATGVALGPHPHLEVRFDTPESYWDTRNPELWIAPGPGLGTLAVRVTNADNGYLPGVRVYFTCADGAKRYMDTYWYNGVNPDDTYGENAAMMNLPAGYCDLEADAAGETITFENALIKAGEVTLVWMKTRK
jgi:murein DD-endopeptidase MepM/ murein hydrolase activator NlpD